ncbi:MAG TPA: XrtA/PEP-CTERM system TPR-repeat protein PrsT [Burkholderiaceae bacterium]|nr:XrtA/PEP-CTERM system TPR-repeat protein PrsT [Burkholderiaceae bacterium]
MNSKFSSSRNVLLAVLTAALLASCGGEKPETLLASAKEYMAKNDNKAAIIQIKNALQGNPNLPEARFLLGEALLKTGDAAAAEVEFGKALELQHSKDAVVPLLAKALLAQGKFKKVADEISSANLTVPAAKADVQTSLAAAYAALGKQDLSAAALNAALAADPEFSDALLVQVRQKAATGEFDGALALVERVLAKTPKSHEAWRSKGDVLLFGKKDQAGALQAYRMAVQVKPDFVLGYASVMTVLLAQGDTTEATKELEQMKKVAPNNPQTRYFDAQVAFASKDFKRARELSQQLLKVAPDNPRSLQLAGAVEFQLNSLVQAESHLSKAVQAAPELAGARRLLILTYLRTGQPAKALATLPANLSREERDGEMLSAAGQAYLQTGDVKKAEEYFSKAAKIDPKDAKKRTSLAVAHMLKGDVDSAFVELQDIAESDKGTTADLALVSAYLRRKEYDKALKAIDALEKKQPGDPLAANLRGMTYMAKQDLAAARKSFEQALSINPTYFPATSNLAALDLGEKKPEDARKRYENLLAKDPKNVQALVALADLRAKAGATKEELAELIGKAISANPTEAAPRLMLIDLHLRGKEFKQALSAAQNAVAALPDNVELVDALGRVQLASGDYNQALASYNKLAGMQPGTPQPHLRIAAVHLAEKKPDAAIQSLRKALEIKPDQLDAQRGLVALYLQEKKVDDAVAMARTVQKQRPKEPTGFLLEGDIASSQKKWDLAIGIYRKAMTQVPAPELAVNLHAVLLAAGKTAESEKLSASWLKENPKDPVFRLYLADGALARQDLGAAEKSYLGVLQLQANNAMALNNLAWITAQLKKDGALAYAEKANRLAPNQPAFMDTMAMVLAEKSDFAKAVDWQSRAIKLQPDNAGLKLNLARIHIKAGNKEPAKKELSELAALGEKFPGQAEVARLLKSL